VATRRTLQAAVVYFALTVGAHAQSGTYLSDLPRLYPAVYSTWTQSLPDALGTIGEWLRTFRGVATPVRDVAIHGLPMKFATTCVPHNCGGNIAGILFSPQRSRIIAVARLTGRNQSPTVMVIGQMTNAEFACMQRLIDNDQLPGC
jgi:hypothetical protein